MRLGELVKQDRERAGQSQKELAYRLKGTEPHPIDPFTKRPKLASRTWVQKLEAGTLKRDVPADVREWLATALEGNPDRYATLPLRSADDPPPSDLFKEQDEFLRNALDRFAEGSQVQIDAPTSGPLSNQRPHLLRFLAGIVTKHDSELVVFINQSTPATTSTFSFMTLLYLIVGELARGARPTTSDDLRTHFAALDWDEDIEETTRAVFEAVRRGRYERSVRLDQLVRLWLDKHLTVHLLKSRPESTARYNPSTIVLVESAFVSKCSAYVLDGRHRPWDLAEISSVTRTFEERRRLFTPFRPDFSELAAHASVWGIKMEMET